MAPQRVRQRLAQQQAQAQEEGQDSMPTSRFHKAPIEDQLRRISADLHKTYEAISTLWGTPNLYRRENDLIIEVLDGMNATHQRLADLCEQLDGLDPVVHNSFLALLELHRHRVRWVEE